MCIPDLDMFSGMLQVYANETVYNVADGYSSKIRLYTVEASSGDLVEIFQVSSSIIGVSGSTWTSLAIANETGFNNYLYTNTKDYYSGEIPTLSFSATLRNDRREVDLAVKGTFDSNSSDSEVFTYTNTFNNSFSQEFVIEAEYYYSS